MLELLGELNNNLGNYSHILTLLFGIGIGSSMRKLIRWMLSPYFSWRESKLGARGGQLVNLKAAADKAWHGYCGLTTMGISNGAFNFYITKCDELKTHVRNFKWNRCDDKIIEAGGDVMLFIESNLELLKTAARTKNMQNLIGAQKLCKEQTVPKLEEKMAKLKNRISKSLRKSNVNR